MIQPHLEPATAPPPTRDTSVLARRRTRLPLAERTSAPADPLISIRFNDGAVSVSCAPPLCRDRLATFYLTGVPRRSMFRNANHFFQKFTLFFLKILKKAFDNSTPQLPNTPQRQSRQGKSRGPRDIHIATSPPRQYKVFMEHKIRINDLLVSTAQIYKRFMVQYTHKTFITEGPQ